jgi:hypothetical protein
MRTPRKLVAVAGAAVVSLVALTGPAHAASPVTLNPASGFFSGETIEVKVGPNAVFTPGAGINIIECAVGASSANNCDGNTIQADTILAGTDGSFDYKNYTVFSLPNSIFGASAIKCDSSTPCILYVGQNQNDFTAPKMFSDPINIAAQPPTQTPEVPYATLLPLAALCLFGGAYLVLRRRRRHVLPTP